MKLSEINISELKDLYDMLISYNNHIGNNMRLSETDKTRYEKWFKEHSKVQDRLRMVHNEINKRIDLIEE